MRRDVQLHKLNRKRKRERIIELESEMHSFSILAFSCPSLHPFLFLPSLTHTWTCQLCIAENFPAALRHLTLALPVKDCWGHRKRLRERERVREDVLMNPLTEQRVHLSGNPIKSQGEMLLCFPLIIASLPCTAATALFQEVYWDSGAGGVGEWGELGSWAGGGKKKGERETFSLCTQCSHVAPHAPHLLDFFVPLLLLLLPLSPSLSLSLCPSFPPLHSPLSSFFNLLFIA